MGFLVCLYALGWFRNRGGAPGRFYGWLLLAVSGAAGVLLSANLLMLVLFWELVTLMLFLLVASGRPQGAAGAMKAFVLLGLGESLLASDRAREAQLALAQVSALDHSDRDRVARALLRHADDNLVLAQRLGVKQIAVPQGLHDCLTVRARQAALDQHLTPAPGDLLGGAQQLFAGGFSNNCV